MSVACRSRAGASATPSCGWCERLAGIERDLPGGAAPTKVDDARLVELTPQSKPESATHWSTRSMAAALGVNAASVSRHWRANGLKPHLVRSFIKPKAFIWTQSAADILQKVIRANRHLSSKQNATLQ